MIYKWRIVSSLNHFLNGIKNWLILYFDWFRGKFGIVRRCTEKSTKKKFAAKFIVANRVDDRKEVEREVDIMRSLQHPRLLQLYDAFDDGKTQMCLIMEWSVS